MKKSILICFIISFFNSSLNAQKDGVLMSINGNPVYKSEFEQIYWKNKKEAIATKDDLNEYIQLFKNFKLKVAAAEEMGLDTLNKFIKELNGYKAQLEKPYLTDTAINQELIKEAYQRTLNEINASHILIKINSESPKDTLSAYKKMISIRDMIINKEINFEEAAVKYSNDESAIKNKGNLGFFGAFRMIYDFETVCYNTPLNEISMPFRTQYGYHIVKINEHRKNRGKIKVAHIMVAVKESDDKKTDDNKYQKIQEIHQKLIDGASFKELAQEYSDDRQSARKGGELDWIQSSGNYYKEFENAVFSLKEDNEISEPFLTPAGWHIVKRIKHLPIGDLKSLKNEINNKIQRYGRSEVSKKTFIESLKKEYNFKSYPENLKKVIDLITKKDFNKEMVLENEKNLQSTLFEFTDNQYKQIDFTFFMLRSDLKEVLNFDEFISGRLNSFVAKKLIEFEKTQLERKYPEFKGLLKEYRDGILLFEISDQMIWTKAIKDTSGLKEFYEKNKNQWKWSERADVEIFSSNNSKIIKKAFKLKKKGKLKNDSIINFLNNDSQLNLQFEEGKKTLTDHPVLKNEQWKQGINKPKIIDNKYHFVVIKNKIPAGPKKLNEAEGTITAAYQQYLEKEWLKELADRYPIEINYDVLYSISTKPN